MDDDIFSKTLENPDKVPVADKEELIDVGDVSSSEEEHDEHGEETSKQEAEDPKSSNQELSDVTLGSSMKEAELRSENCALKSSGIGEEVQLNESGSKSDDDADSDGDSSSSSEGEVPVMDEDDEEEPSPQGPIKSKNEIEEEPVPEVPAGFEINEKTAIEEIGVVKSAFDFNIIVHALGSAERRVLKEGSILCLGDRTILGPLCEVFGPLQRPFYRVSFPKEKADYFDQIKERVSEKVYYVSPAAHWLDTFEIKKIRGTDASNGFDEELPEEEQEFSDDEKEAEYKRMKKQSKKRKNETEASQDNHLAKKSGSKPQWDALSGPNLPSRGVSSPAKSGYRSRSARQSEKHTSTQSNRNHVTPASSAPFIPQPSSHQQPITNSYAQQPQVYPYNPQGYNYQKTFPFQQPYPAQYNAQYAQAYPGQYQQPYGTNHIQQQYMPSYGQQYPPYQQQYVQPPANAPPAEFMQPHQSQQTQQSQILQLQQILMQQRQQQNQMSNLQFSQQNNHQSPPHD